jgi:hypothetical protein
MTAHWHHAATGIRICHDSELVLQHDSYQIFHGEHGELQQVKPDSFISWQGREGRGILAHPPVYLQMLQGRTEFPEWGVLY